MAQGMRNGGTDRARRALESCIARLRRGETIAQALADCSHDSDELRSLLSTFDLVRQAAVAPPAPPRGLAQGRDRFLAAAAVMRASAQAPAGAAHAVEADAAAEALDRALVAADGAASGTADSPSAGAELEALVDVATSLRRAAVPVPALNGALASGRARFMAAADALRCARSEQADAATEAVDADMLDAALADIASGAAVRATAAASGAAAPDVLAEMLAVARDLAGATPAPTTITTDAHRAGRAGFLAAAQGLAIATGRQPAEADIDAELLDAAIARMRAGDPVADIVGQASGAAATALAGLLGTVQSLSDATPAPEAALGVGRARFLEVAGGVRRLRMPERTAGAALAAGPAGWLANAVRPLRPHVAALAAAITLAFFAGNALLVPVSAGARPGDGLLYRHKLLMQDLRLVVATVNPGWRDDVRAEISRERLADIAAAGGEGVELSVDGRLRGFEDLTEPGEKGHGLIHMAALGEDGDKALTAAWRAGETRFALPTGYDSLADVPAGTSMRLKIRTGTEPPLAMKVALLGLDPLVPLTATLTVTATSTITPTGVPATATPTPTAEAATATATATPDATSTLVPTPSVTPTLAATATAVQNPVQERNPQRGQELEGQILRIGAADWTVRRAANVRNGDLNGNAVDVEVSVVGLTNARAALSVQVGDRVRLRGEYVGGRRDRFAAVKMIGHMPKGEGCKDRGAVLGVVTRYLPDTALVLQDGTAFEIDPTAPPTISGVLELGRTVVVEHQECGGRLVARAITVTDGTGQATPESQEYNGVVRDVLDARTMAVEIAGTRYTVRFDPATVRYQGAPIAVERGQRVSVWGRLVDVAAGVIDAERVEVLRLASPPPTEAPTEAPTATATQAPSATPEPSPTLTPGAIDVRPEPLPPGLPAPPERPDEG